MEQEQEREARAKAIRQMILSCKVKLEDFSKDKSHHEKEDLPDFPKEMEENSEDCEPPSEKRAKRSTSPLTGKNFNWLEEPSQRKFTPLNSVRNFSGKGKGAAETISSPIEAWFLLFSDEVLNNILKYTNQEIEQYRRRAKNLWGYCNLLDMLELKAFIGLLYYASWAKKNNVFECKYFWKHPYFSLLLFKKTTSQRRLKFLFQNLVFDDKTTRDERIKSDCFARIREIWDLFIANCIQYYEPGYNVTIDEQILSFHENCIADMIPISRKRGKYGVKYVTMNDSETFYMINAILYINNKTKPLGRFPSYYVNEVSKPIHNTCRNITCSRWFTSVPLVDTMHEKYFLTMVGSLRRDNPDVPPLFKSELAKETCQFLYHNSKTLVSYKPENDKMILLLSSLHSEGEINKVENKPEIVLHYNKTMGANDKFDQLCREYTVKRTTRKWSVQIFYSMLDQAAVNSFVLYTLNANNQLITRDIFLLTLSMDLIKPYLIKLLSRPNLPIFVQCRLKSFLDEYDFPENYTCISRLDDSNKLSKKESCYLCPSERTKTYYKCLKCNNPMCTIHEASICKDCAVD